MNPDLLAQLKDIKTPEPVGHWPLAWGWWLVIAIAVICVLFTSYWLFKQYQHRSAKRQALKLLHQLKDEAPMAKVAGLNQVLKRANLAYQHRDAIADLSGDDWAKWLNQHKKYVQITPELLHLTYRPDCSEEEANLYYLQVQQWLKKALPLKPVPLANRVQEAKDV
jgi:hypothetical protein